MTELLFKSYYIIIILHSVKESFNYDIKKISFSESAFISYIIILKSKIAIKIELIIVKSISKQLTRLLIVRNACE